VQLYDLFVGSLVPCIAAPTLTGVCPRRRRHCLRRLLPIWRIHSQWFASTASPRLAEAPALTLHRRRSPEPHRRQWPLRHHLRLSSRSTFPTSAALDTWCFRTAVSSWALSFPRTSLPATSSPEHGHPNFAPLLSLAKDLGLEGAKAQGAICKP
jgi:hypothetical protein